MSDGHGAVGDARKKIQRGEQGSVGSRLTEEDRERIHYAAEHLIGAENNPDDPHAGDSRDLAWDELEAIVARHVEAERRECGADCGDMLEREQARAEQAERTMEEWRRESAARRERAEQAEAKVARLSQALADASRSTNAVLSAVAEVARAPDDVQEWEPGDGELRRVSVVDVARIWAALGVEGGDQRG